MHTKTTYYAEARRGRLYWEKISIGDDTISKGEHETFYNYNYNNYNTVEHNVVGIYFYLCHFCLKTSNMINY